MIFSLHLRLITFFCVSFLFTFSFDLCSLHFLHFCFNHFLYVFCCTRVVCKGDNGHARALRYHTNTMPLWPYHRRQRSRSSIDPRDVGYAAFVSHLDLSRASYVLYGVKYIDLVTLDAFAPYHDVSYCLTTFSFIWGSLASHVFSSSTNTVKYWKGSPNWWSCAN